MTIWVSLFLQNVFLQKSVLIIYKSFIRPHLDYGDIHDQPTNDSFSKKLTSVQYNAALAITEAIIKGSSQEKLYKELPLESIKLGRKLWWLCTFYKSKTTGLPIYLLRQIPNTAYSYQTKTIDNVTIYQCRVETFKWLLSLIITAWNSLDINLIVLLLTELSKNNWFTNLVQFQSQLLALYLCVELFISTKKLTQILSLFESSPQFFSCQFIKIFEKIYSSTSFTIISLTFKLNLYANEL